MALKSFGITGSYKSQVWRCFHGSFHGKFRALNITHVHTMWVATWIEMVSGKLVGPLLHSSGANVHLEVKKVCFEKQGNLTSDKP